MTYGFDKAYQGLIMEATDASGAEVYTYNPSTGYLMSVSGQGVVNGQAIRTANGGRVWLTGVTIVSAKGNKAYQTSTDKYIILSQGWYKTGYKAVGNWKDQDAQRLINGIIRNNITITQNNLVCARFRNKFTATQLSQIKSLQRRVQKRAEAIKNDGLCKDVKTSYPKGYADLEPYLAGIMNDGSIAIATWAFCLISAIVIAGLGTAAYFTYKAFFDESEKDVKFSKELTKILEEKLTPEEYEKLKQETQGIVTKARIRQSVASYGNILKYALFGVAGYFIYKKVKEIQKTRRSNG